MTTEPEQDAVLQTIARMLSSLEDFYWDAISALNINGISGDYVEFGSVGANTLGLVHDVIRRTPVDRHLWAFDSFSGLPTPVDARDAHPAWAPGTPAPGVDAFHAACAAKGIPRDAYTAIEGYYEQTLTALGPNDPPSDIALAYVDCNMYSSTVSVLEFLAPRLKHGMIVAFDDYFCWSPDNVSGERAALHEFLADHPEWRFQRYKDCHWAGTSFVVERADLLRP